MLNTILFSESTLQLSIAHSYHMKDPPHTSNTSRRVVIVLRGAALLRRRQQSRGDRARGDTCRVTRGTTSALATATSLHVRRDILQTQFVVTRRNTYSD